MKLNNAVDTLLLLDSNTAGDNQYTSVGSNIAQVNGSDGEVQIASADDELLPIAITLVVSAIDETTTDETYFWEIEFGTDNTFATLVGDGLNEAITEAKQYDLIVLPPLGARWARLNYTLAGTTPILDVAKAFIADVKP